MTPDRRALIVGATATPLPTTAAQTGEPPFFPGFQTLDMEAGGVRFRGALGGAGPPLLLLHGYPETHIAWRKVAGDLARRHTVVAPDLPGYGSSRTRSTMPRWTKRRVGASLVELMGHLGHRRFALVGHDRGARAGYRLALDHPGTVCAFASLAVVPTIDAMEGVDYLFARKNYHWFLFAQPDDLPERMLAAAPDEVIEREFEVTNADDDAVVEPSARAAYREAFRDPAVRHAMCEDYRSALEEDLEHDRADRDAGRRLDCPVLVLWPENRVEPGSPTPLDTWRRWSDEVTGGTTTGGHMQPDDRPAEVLGHLVPFLDRHRPPES